MTDLFDNKDIRLRALEPEDLDALYRWENDSRLWQYGAAINPYSRFSLKQYIENANADINQTKQLRMIIVEKKSEKLVGTIDLYDFDFIHKRAGVGILIDEEFRGKGYALQALNCIREYVLGHLGMKQIYAFVPKTNIPSLHLFEKAGYEKTAVLKKWLSLKLQFTDVVVFQIIQPN